MALTLKQGSKDTFFNPEYSLWCLLMTVNHKTVDHSLTVIKNTLRKG